MVFVLYTRRGCHLCEEAEDMLAAHAQERTVELVDIDLDPDLRHRYGTRVPVLTADGAPVLEGRFEEVALVRLLHRHSRDR